MVCADWEGRGLDDDIQIGERTCSAGYQQGAVLYTERGTISTVEAVCGSAFSSEKEPPRSTMSTQQHFKDNSTVKNKRTWLHFFKNQYQNCSTLCFFLTCWQCWASEWWIVNFSLIFASQDYDQTHTQIPTRSAYAHHSVFNEFIHNLQLFLFPSPINNNLARKEV